MCYSLAQAWGDTIQDDVHEIVVCCLDIDIESIDIVQVFLDSTCLFEIPDLVKSPVRLAMVALVFPNGILNFLPSIKPMLVRFPSFHNICFSS